MFQDFKGKMDNVLSCYERDTFMHIILIKGLLQVYNLF
jgi:hypothetical protein